MTGWKSESIAAERRTKAETALAGASREELLDRIIALETSLYKLTYSLHELDIEPTHRGSAWMSSKLFPHRGLADVDYTDTVPEATDIIAEALMQERERCAAICDKEVAAMQRVADFHRPPRVDYDPELADMHDQGAAVAFKLAAAIRSQTP